MNSDLFELIQINAQRLVKNGIILYEQKFKKFTSDDLKQKFTDSLLSIFLEITRKIFEQEDVSLVSISDLLLSILFELNFDSETFVNAYKEVNNEVFAFLDQESNNSSSIKQSYNTYLFLIEENINDYSVYTGSEILNILNNNPQYQYSESTYSIIPKEVSKSKIYTLFPKERYWEIFSGALESEVYSPLSYNKSVVSAGFPSEKVNFLYEDCIVYKDKVYKLNPQVDAPSRIVFNEKDWIEYDSRRLKKSETFKTSYLSKVQSVLGKISEDGFDINSIISDSYIPTYTDSAEKIVPNENFISSFGGVGNQIIKVLGELESLSNTIGGYEGSLLGGLEYVAKFSQYLLSCTFGVNLAEEGFSIDGVPSFGKFDILFGSKISTNKVPGLKFLNSFNRLRSFVHDQSVSFNTENLKTQVTLIYNPVYEQFFPGIKNSFVGFDPNSGSFNESKANLLYMSLDRLYKKCNVIGDVVQSGINSLDSLGRSSGYEGLGSIEFQLKKLQNVFPPSRLFINYPRETTVAPGLTGSIRYFRNNYQKLLGITKTPLLPGKSLEFLKFWIDKITSKLEEISQIISDVGIDSQTFIPNLSFKQFIYDDKKLLDFLVSIGFRDSEINQLLNLGSYTELINTFAPLSDSSDLKSFFRAYELTELIYEIGGEEAINAYLSFLYSSSRIDSLLNILEISLKDKSVSTYRNITLYPKLIGLLIGLTYAIDPNQLSKFNKILKSNNLNLLESINFLFQQGETTIIKSPNEIDLLRPLIEQSVVGTYLPDAYASNSLTYAQVNKEAPLGLKQWTSEIGDNLGWITSRERIEDLYDRSVGLTPRELISILDYPDSPNLLGGLVDGFSGGKFTSFLKYVNLSGLAFKLGFYKNSYQTNNFEVVEKSTGLFFNEFFKGIEDLSKDLLLFNNIFDSALIYSFNYEEEFVQVLDPLIKAQNKKFDLMPLLLQQGITGRSTEELGILASDFEILESPGIGNSRLPNRIPAVNSLTPEQANILLSENQQLLEVSSITSQNLSVINKFIKFSFDNLLANSIQLSSESDKKEESKLKPKLYKNATKYEINRNLSFTSGDIVSTSKDYSSSPLYKIEEGGLVVKSSGLGSNYVDKQIPVVDSILEAFDPVKSCEKFGGFNCNELYSSVADRCVGSINKSLFPEEYKTIPGISPTSVIIDRPLGTFSEYKPQEEFIPLSSFSQPASYFELLPKEAIPGPKGEPLLQSIGFSPLVFDTGGGELSEYGDTEFGIVEFINSKLERNSEFGCAGFDSPFLYQICMNVMKCKRFNPPTDGKNFLDFCPKTLSGGRLK